MKRARTYLTRQARALRRDEEGATLVEFGLLLPTFILFFAMAVEGSRTFWSYQATISGVRDAARYVGRAVQADVCSSGGGVDHMAVTVSAIVRESSSGATLFPSSITVTSVTPSLTCLSGDFRLAQTPIATVTAQLEITYPFSQVFSYLGISLPTVSTSVTDQSRIFGA